MKQAERPGLRRWTRREYERLIDHGPHRTAVLLVAKAVERAFGEGGFVQTQSPIILDDRSEPEPDVCVVRGSPRDYVDAIRRARRSSSRSRRRAWAWPEDGRPQPTPARGSRTAGS